MTRGEFHEGPGPLMLRGDRPADLVACARLLRGGGIAVVPTDTVYGIFASVFRAEALTRVSVLKGRRPGQAFPVLLATAADLPIVAEKVPVLAWTLIERFWPGPLTIVLPARDSVPASITGGTGTVGIRVPAASSALRLLEVLGEPVIGTSANRGGEPPALMAQQARAALGEDVDAILVDDSAIRAEQASTVVAVSENLITVHREGALALRDLREATSVRVVKATGEN